MFTHIPQHVQQLAENHPDKSAFIFLANGETEKGRLSYAELNEQALKISVYLQAHSQLGDRIVLCYLPGLEFISAFLGCLYAGRTAVPVYPLRNNHHAKRLLTILEDCHPALILGTEESLAFMQDQAHFSEYRYVLHAVMMEQAAPKNIGKNIIRIKENTLAFLQYTSGSTGTPKGVMVSHANVMANLAAIHYFYGLTSTDNIVSWLPMQHDMGLIGQLLYTLYCGTTEILMPPAAFLERPIRWLQAITRYQGHAAGGPNFAYTLCVERIAEAQLIELDLRPWKIAFNGSEPIRVETLIAFAEKFKSCGFTLQKFLPCYGMAETTLLISGKPHQEAPLITKLNQKPCVSSGKIHPGYKLKVVDPETQKQKNKKEIGEIWVSGACVAQGYWNKKDLSTQTFKAKLAGDQANYLRTGDFGYLDGEALYVTGRLKDLIILQGRNIYPQDVEAAVESATDAIRIGCTAAFSVEAASQEQLVIVAEIKRTHRKVDFQPVFSLIRQAVLQMVDAIPFSIQLIAPAKAFKTTSGKIQRQATKAAYLANTLDCIAADTLSISQTIESTSQTLEQEITHLLKKLFGMTEVDPQQSFAALGGTSLEAIILHQQLQTYVGDHIKLPLTLMFDYPTVSDLAAYLSSRLNKEEEVGAASVVIYQDAPLVNFSPLLKADRNLQLPLSLSERAAWVAHQEKSGNSYLNMKMLIFIEHVIQHDIFELALKTIVHHQEILRTSYHQDQSGKLYRKLHSTADAVLEFHDLTKQKECDVEQRLQTLAQTVEYTNFQLNSLPLFKFILVKVSQAKFALVFSMHHIIGDGISIGCIFSDLMQTYQAMAHKSVLPVPNPTLTYTDYANWQHQAYAAGHFSDLLKYWEKQLIGAEELMLPYDYLKTTFASDAAGIVSLHLNTEQVRQLKTFAVQHKVSFYVLLMGAFQLLLKQQTLQNTFLIETILSNRADPDRKSMLGTLAIDAVVLYQVNEKSTVIHFLNHLLAQTLELNQLLRDCGPLIYNAATKISPRQPVVGINFHSQPVDSAVDFKIKMDAKYFARDSLPGHLDLFLEIWPTHDSQSDQVQEQFVLDFIYRKSVFRNETIEGISTQFLKVLTFFLDQPNVQLEDFHC